MATVPWKGAEKVAAFLLSLDPEMASSLLSQMEEEDITAIGSAMATIDPATLEEDTLSNLHKEFVDAMIQDTGPEPTGPPPLQEVLEELLSRALPADRARQVRAKIEVAAKRSRPFMAIEKLKIDTLKKTLEGEHPQIVALVCAKMSPDTTALVLGNMSDEERNDVVRRMAVLEPPKDEDIREVVKALETKAAAFKPAKTQEVEVEEEKFDPVKQHRAVAEILKTVDLEVEKSILAGLDEKDPELAKLIREKMFTFEDLAILEKKAMQKVLMGFEIRTLAVALKAADPRVEANFLNNMAKRVQGMLAEERELLEEASVEDIQEAQKEIMDTVRSMIESGEIVIPRKGSAGAKSK